MGQASRQQPAFVWKVNLVTSAGLLFATCYSLGSALAQLQKELLNRHQIKLAAYHSELHFLILVAYFIKCNSRYMQQPKFTIYCADLFIRRFQCSATLHALCIISQHYGRKQMVLYYGLHFRVSGSTELQNRFGLTTCARNASHLS